MSHWLQFLSRDTVVFIALMTLGAGISILDNRLGLHTILVEVIHALVVTGILVFCIRYQRKYPDIGRFGWNQIVLGIACLAVGSWVDILDDPPVIAWLNQTGVPFGRTWQQAFIKKILGYTAGTGLMAVGFSRWIPWMIQAREKESRLNQRITQTNRELQQVLLHLDDRVEAERLHIARELHDDVAQQLTFVGVQLQLLQKESVSSLHSVAQKISALNEQVRDVLKQVRRISMDLRPEALYALGLTGALEAFFEKQREQDPQVHIRLVTQLLPEPEHKRLESLLTDRERLHIFRVLQESIRNAIRHGLATVITVYITETKSTYTFVVQDNGAGLPWQAMPAIESLVQDGHLGVAGLTERVNELNGVFSLQNRSDGLPGAEVRVILNK